MCKGTIFNIQRFSTSDGPGVRTVVFFKGCPLRCGWCHNPESQRGLGEVLFKQELCIGCGGCVAVCPNRCHSLQQRRFDRTDCVGCGRCAEACDTNALEFCGEEMTAEEIMAVVLRDEPFYRESGGGMTLSGGEPLLQYDLTLALLRLAKQHGLHTAIETSGYTDRDLASLQEYTDQWLYDIKLLDDEAHRTHTGVSNGPILENLRLLDGLGASIVLRCPIIPGVNMDEAHFDALAELANSLEGVAAIHLEPYHPLGLSKAQQLGRPQPYENGEFLPSAALQPLTDRLRASTKNEVVVL